MKPKPCDHSARRRGDKKVCASCNADLGLAYTEERLMENVAWILGQIASNYEETKAKFLEEAAKDPSSAIRWNAYKVLVEFHRRGHANLILDALCNSKTLQARRKLLEMEERRLTDELTKSYAIEWDTSTCPFSNQDVKAQHVAKAKTIETIHQILYRFEALEADMALEVMS